MHEAWLLRHKSKAQIVAYFDEHGASGLLEQTSSCYEGRACGECHACRARAQGMAGRVACTVPT